MDERDARRPNPPGIFVDSAGGILYYVDRDYRSEKRKALLSGGCMNRWTVHVTDFGKIKKADIQVAPLTVFVGDNNSGKSYMMTLIYGLLHIRFFFSRYRHDTNSEAYQSCSRILDKIMDVGLDEIEKDYSLKGEELQAFVKLMNEILCLSKERFLEELFNRQMEIGDFYLSFPENLEVDFCARNVWDIKEESCQLILYGREDDGRLWPGYGTSVKQMAEQERTFFFLSYVMEYMLKRGFSSKGMDEIIYLPTARTGYLLTYKTLIGSAMKDKFNLQSTDKNLLTRPNSDFLSALGSMAMENEQQLYRSVIEFIEDKIISGHISVSKLPAQDIVYVPEGAEKQLPMFVSSGVVTEITPLLLFLEYGDMGTLMMEEPEISLHPTLQWSMARALIRLKNAGMPVFITTHSDIMLQHMNNMIRLSKLDGKKKKTFLTECGYDQEDLLNGQDIAVYQFDVKENFRTEVTRLTCGDYGFEAMTFYQMLELLNHQIDKLENMED